ncbi:MAG: LPS assembly lipoprotein LptE [Planctomycetota bacterium]
MTQKAALLSAVTLLVGLAGCGYKAGGPYRSGIQTVYIDMAGTREFRRFLEYDLTEALKKRLNSQGTPYRLAPREKADSILQVEILEVVQNAFAPDYETRQPRDTSYTLAVRVLWRDLRSGRILLDTPVQLETVDYLPPTGETEAYASDKATDRLAAAIVRKMYEDW